MMIWCSIMDNLLPTKPAKALFAYTIWLLNLIPIIKAADPFFLTVDCPNANLTTTATYASNSTYQTNLESLLTVLSSNSTVSTGFYNFTAGTSPPDIAYGLFLCRGDRSAAECRDCVVYASSDIVKQCPSSKRVTIWYDECMLRYSNQSILSDLDVEGGLVMWNTANVTDVTRLNQVLGKVFRTLLYKSAVAKLKALTTPELVQNALRELNFNDVSVKSLGGMKIIITFQSRDDITNALTNPIIVNWFKLIKPWNGEVAGESRIIWLKCRGMPLTVWNVASFKRMGEIWGEFITLDVETMKEESYDVGRLMIATEQPQRIEEWINITVRGKIHKVKVWEEDCDDIFNEKPISDWVNKQQDELRILHVSDQAKVNEPSLSKNVREKVVAKNTLGINKEGDQDQDRLKDDVNHDVDAVNQQMENVLEPSADVGSKYESQHHDSCSEEVANSNIEADMPPIFNEEAIVMDSIISSLGTENSVVGSEIVADSLEKISMEYQPQSNNEEHLDHFEANQAPIQAAIKGIKGKRNRKSIDEILGYTKVNARNTNGKRNNKKCVVLRSAVASAALSASISSGGINNRNKILLDEAQAI